MPPGTSTRTQCVIDHNSSLGFKNFVAGRFQCFCIRYRNGRPAACSYGIEDTLRSPTMRAQSLINPFTRVTRVSKRLFREVSHGIVQRLFEVSNRRATDRKIGLEFD
jgi:hypothetical protein